MLLRIIDNRLFRSIDNILLDWKDGVNFAFLIDSLAPGSWEDFEDLTPESGIICQVSKHNILNGTFKSYIKCKLVKFGHSSLGHHQWCINNLTY